MKKMKLLTISCFFSIVMAAKAKTNVTETATETSVVETATVKANEDRIMELLNSSSDPFRFEQGGGKGAPGVNIGQMDVTKVSSLIKVKGVLVLEGSDPCALVTVGSGLAQLIHEDDLIHLPLSLPARKHGKISAPVNKVKYLIVKEINKNNIIVAPEQRPQELIKIR